MYLPYDPAMLYSMINMKLRDEYESLDILCEELDIDKDDLESRLNDAGFQYDPRTNQFG